MGKVDDMRRLREAQHEQGQKAARARVSAEVKPAAAAVAAPASSAAKAVAAPAEVDPVEDAMVPRAKTAAPATASSGRGKRGAVADETGVCSGCGKAKPLQRGVIASHQKGLGKMCAGSRKPPA